MKHGECKKLTNQNDKSLKEVICEANTSKRAAHWKSRRMTNTHCCIFIWSVGRKSRVTGWLVGDLVVTRKITRPNLHSKSQSNYSSAFWSVEQDEQNEEDGNDEERWGTKWMQFKKMAAKSVENELGTTKKPIFLIAMPPEREQKRFKEVDRCWFVFASFFDRNLPTGCLWTNNLSIKWTSSNDSNDC